MPGAETFLSSADAYERHVGRYGTQLATGLIEFAGVVPPMRALDVGCGTGALTAVLADRLGTDRVTGADPSQTFGDACRARLPGVEVVLAGAEQLPFGEDTFDAVLSQLVVNFMRDPVQGVREMARVARPGGIVSSCVWDYAGEMTLLRAFWDARPRGRTRSRRHQRRGNRDALVPRGRACRPVARRGAARGAVRAAERRRPVRGL
jgi:ubiquinone/menaquinone biosynthesis C-methylase UbiE